MIIAVDLDGTLCEKVHWTKHSSALPLIENIRKVNQLYENGNTIVIYTGRFPDDEEITRDWLAKFEVRYHRLVMGKLIADLYIDNDSRRLDEL